MTNAAFVESWFLEWRPDPPVFGRASRLLSKLVEQRPVEAWRRINALVASASTAEDLEYVGAGPLEDLLCAHGEQFISLVEVSAKANPRMAQCLKSVWAPNRMSAAIHARIEQFFSSAGWSSASGALE